MYLLEAGHQISSRVRVYIVSRRQRYNVALKMHSVAFTLPSVRSAISPFDGDNPGVSYP